MKKLFAFALLLSLFASCSKDEETEISFTSESFEVNYNETINIPVLGDGVVLYSSSDVSIATVASDGKVKGLRVGEVTITATDGSKTVSCNVVVKPTLSTYIEPYVKYACKAADIKAKETRTLLSESVNELLYTGENSNVKSVSYLMYSTTGMLGATVTLKLSVGIDVVKSFLEQRYPLTKSESGLYVFDNNSVIITLTSSTNVGIVVVYEPYPIVK